MQEKQDNADALVALIFTGDKYNIELAIQIMVSNNLKNTVAIKAIERGKKEYNEAKSSYIAAFWDAIKIAERDITKESFGDFTDDEIIDGYAFDVILCMHDKAIDFIRKTLTEADVQLDKSGLNLTFAKNLAANVREQSMRLLPKVEQQTVLF